MSNTFMTVNEAAGIVAKGAAAMLENQLHFCKTISKVDPSVLNGVNGHSSGETIYINKPPRFTVQTDDFDRSSDKDDIVEEKVAMPMDIIASIGLDTSSLEFAYETQLKSYMETVIKPAISRMAQSVEQQVVERASDAVYNSVGTPGSGVYDTSTILDAKTKLSQYTTPLDNNRFLLLDSVGMSKAVNARKGYFQSSSEIDKQYKSGVIGRADGFNWMESELLSEHTNGNDVSFEVKTTVSVEGQATLAVTGLTTTTGTVKKGTVFTIDTVYAVNPITKKQLGHLQQFVVTADATADGSGDATLSISPAIYTSASDGLQSVSAFPADGDTCNPLGSASTAYTQGLAYHKEAFRMCSVPLFLPRNAEFAQRATHNGISVAIIRDFDVDTRKLITRLDFLGGFVADRPEYACRVWG